MNTTHTPRISPFDRGEVHAFCSVRYDQPAPADCAYPQQHTPKICRTCGFTHPGTDCPRWSEPMFDALTKDELMALQNMIITTGKGGYGSNRMAYMLALYSADPQLGQRYADIANEISEIFNEVCNTLLVMVAADEAVA